MKNKFGWFLTTLAIMTFTFGQGSAAAVQIATAQAAAVPAAAVPAAAVPAAAVPAAAVPAAAVPAAAVPAAVVSNAPVSPTDLTKVPHYFGPYSNWTNSPQVLSDAVVTMSPPTGALVPVSVGNPLIQRAIPTDCCATQGTLRDVLVVLPNATLPAGALQSFKYWNQGPTVGGRAFHAYVLRPTPGVPNGYTVVYDSGLQTVPVPTVPTGEVETVAVPNVPVAAGDVIGFYGEGIPLDVGVGTDQLIYPAPVAPVLNGTMTLGVDPGFPIYPQNRTYSFGATVVPSLVVSVGNPLIQRAIPTDCCATQGTLRDVLVVLPNATLPAGALQSFKYWNQGPTVGGRAFHAYVLRPTPGVPNGYTVVYDSGLQTVPVPTVPTGEVETVPVSPSVAVVAGDVIGFYGEGIPLDVGVGTDQLIYPAPVAPVLNGTMTLGVDPGFPIYPQNR